MVLTAPYVSPSGRSSEIVMWPAAERLVYGTAPKYAKAMAAPPSTRAMRLRAGTELPRAVTPGQDLRAVPARSRIARVEGGAAIALPYFGAVP